MNSLPIDTGRKLNAHKLNPPVSKRKQGKYKTLNICERDLLDFFVLWLFSRRTIKWDLFAFLWQGLYKPYGIFPFVETM